MIDPDKTSSRAEIGCLLWGVKIIFFALAAIILFVNFGESYSDATQRITQHMNLIIGVLFIIAGLLVKPPAPPPE